MTFGSIAAPWRPPAAPPKAHSGARRTLARQQRIEFAFALGLIKLTAASDVGLADPNLRYGPAALGLERHLRAQPGLAADIDLFEGDAFLLQQLLGHGAIRTKARGVERNVRHRDLVACGKARRLCLARPAAT